MRNFITLIIYMLFLFCFAGLFITANLYLPVKVYPDN